RESVSLCSSSNSTDYSIRTTPLNAGAHRYNSRDPRGNNTDNIASWHIQRLECFHQPYSNHYSHARRHSYDKADKHRHDTSILRRRGPKWSNPGLSTRTRPLLKPVHSH